MSGGGAVLACAVEEARTANPNTLFISGGDNVGASTFTSFVANDEPTLDVLNEIGLDISTLGNHEFDQGRSDVDGRLTPRADWEWLGANIFDKNTDERPYKAAEVEEFDGVRVGFIGGMTEELGSLVSPSGIADLEVRDLADNINEVAQELKDGDYPGEDKVDFNVVVIHDGAPGEDMSSAAGTPYGKLLGSADDSIVAIVSGHTHEAYIHETDTGLWATQTGHYGEQLGKLSITYDTVDKEVTASAAENIPLMTENGDDYDPRCTPDPAVQAIIDEAVANAEVEGAVKVGEITADINRAQQSDGSENRGGESTLGNAVADVQLWAGQRTSPDALIAFMNPGGLRTDMTHVDPDGDITYKEAAMVQPFANTLMSMDLTGDQIIQILEEQWQPDTSSRPFLKLGISEDLFYTYDPEAARGERIQDVLLDEDPLDPAATYTIIANEFLASGGDNFTTFADGANPADTGQVDLTAMVDYFDEFDSLSPDYGQRAVGLTWVSDPDAVYGADDVIEIDVSSLAFSTDEPKPTQLTTTLDRMDTDPADVNLDIVDTTDEVGRAEVRVTVPEELIETVQPLQQRAIVPGEKTVDLVIMDDANEHEYTVPVQLAVNIDLDDPVTPGDGEGDGDGGGDGDGDGDGDGTTDGDDTTGGEEAAGPGGELPETGADVTGLIALTVLLLGLGTALTLRRSRALHH